MLLYISREGRVGKSQVIKAIVVGMDLILHKIELILIAPTRAAVDNINRNTCYTALDISIYKTPKNIISLYIRKL